MSANNHDCTLVWMVATSVVAAVAWKELNVNIDTVGVPYLSATWKSEPSERLLVVLTSTIIWKRRSYF